jgi:hypothetical protein
VRELSNGSHTEIEIKSGLEDLDLNAASEMLSNTRAGEMEIVLLLMEFSAQNKPEKDIILK